VRTADGVVRVEVRRTATVQPVKEWRMFKRGLLALLVMVGALAMIVPGSTIAQEPDLKVAFIYIGPAGDPGWSYSHDQGRLAVEDAFPNVETAYQELVPENPADAERVIRDFAQKGYGLIFTTSFGYMDPTINVAKDFPDVKFVHVSGYKSADNVANAFGKIEEPRYVSGVVAGLTTKSNKIGYVAAYPIPEVIRGINAFTLGVRSVNPEATVQVVWTNTWFDPQKERGAAEALLDAGADVIAQHQDTAGPQQAAQDRGAFSIGYHVDMAAQAPDAVLTSAVWNWGAYYTSVVQSVLDGTWTNAPYWGGWAEGVVDLAPYGPMVSDEIKAQADEVVAKFKSGEMTITTIFSGPLNDNQGVEQVAAGESMTDEELLGMMWFVEGVDGEIPS
jgi:basic membrane protein A and related proteins